MKRTLLALLIPVLGIGAATTTGYLPAFDRVADVGKAVRVGSAGKYELATLAGPTGSTGATGGTGPTGPDWVTCSNLASAMSGATTGSCGSVVLSSAPTLTGAVAISGSLGVTGNVGVTGILSVTQGIKLPYEVVTATGSSQGTAAALTNTYSVIGGGAAGTGVLLPARSGVPTGRVWWVADGAISTGNHLIYPAGSDVIFTGPLGLSSLSSAAVYANEVTMLVAAGSTGWHAMSIPSYNSSTKREMRAGSFKFTAETTSTNATFQVIGGTASSADFGTFNGTAAGNAGFFMGPISYSWNIRTKTADFTIDVTTSTASERGYRFKNAGASGQIIGTLPSADAGYSFCFIVSDAQNFRVKAAAGDIIRIAGNVGTAAGYTESSTIGSILCLTGVDTTYWFADTLIGTWSNPT